MTIPNIKKVSDLRRSLTLLDAVMILVGSVIGSGIFLVPSDIAREVGSFGMIIAVWMIAGILSLFGALSYAELGSMIPHAGGQYAYLREAYGKLAAFLFGWTEFLVIKAGSIAAVAVAFALYMGHFVILSEIEVKMVAIGCIAVLSGANYLGVRAGAIVQNVFTLAKIFALVALIIMAFVLADAQKSSLEPLWVNKFDFDLFRAFGLAMVAALWAYDGWNNVTYIAAETVDPQRNIPRALFIGMGIVLATYILATLAYSYVLPMPVMKDSELVAADTAKQILGSIGGSLIAGAVMVSTFGTVNGMILSGSRITYAMAKDKVFFLKLGDVHPRFRTPHISILVQGIWSALLTLTGTFEQLFTYVIFAAWIFYAMTTGAVFVFRRKWKDVPRGYSTWGYPWVPAIFIGLSAWLVVNTLFETPRDSLFGLIIILLGLPVYLYWQMKNRTTRQAPNQIVENGSSGVEE